MRQPTIFVLLLSLLVLAACQDDAAKLAEHISRGEAYSEEGKLNEAIIEFKSALQIDPNHADAHFQLAHAFLKHQKPREGFWELRETVRLAPDNHEAVLEFSQLAVIAGEAEEAISQMDRLIQADPASAQAYLVRGQAHLSLKDVETALADFVASTEAEEGYEPGLRAVARLQARGGAYEEARATYDKLIAAHPTFANFVLLTMVLRQLGDEGKAEQEKLLFKALDIAEGDDRSRGYAYLTSFYVGQGRSPEAHALLEKGIETEVEAKLDLIYLRARLYTSEGNQEEADRLIVAATRAEPDNARTHMAMASYRVRTQDDLKSALEAIERALELEPENQNAQLQKAEILSELSFREEMEGGVDEAAAIVAKVLAEQPTHPRRCWSAPRSSSVSGISTARWRSSGRLWMPSPTGPRPITCSGWPWRRRKITARLGWSWGARSRSTRATPTPSLFSPRCTSGSANGSTPSSVRVTT